ncbi:hypothetical protein [Nonomuraea sp. NPDC049784]|uniref:hypothetical protein n=1 Tax=Nonomuraea sp. NPDC049784 TaxID=3154361 RepID=UPI003405161C
MSGGNPLFLRALRNADDNALAELADRRPGAVLALEETLLTMLRTELDSPRGVRAAPAPAGRRTALTHPLDDPAAPPRADHRHPACAALRDAGRLDGWARR